MPTTVDWNPEAEMPDKKKKKDADLEKFIQAFIESTGRDEMSVMDQLREMFRDDPMHALQYIETRGQAPVEATGIRGVFGMGASDEARASALRELIAGSGRIPGSDATTIRTPEGVATPYLPDPPQQKEGAPTTLEGILEAFRRRRMAEDALGDY